MGSEKTSQSSAEMDAEDEVVRSKVGLQVLKSSDLDIEEILSRATFVAAYALDSENAWARADIEGSLYLVRRTSAPKYRLIILNQRSPHNLVENIADNWELNHDGHFIFYRIGGDDGDASGSKGSRVGSLWFSSKRESQRVAKNLYSILEEIQRDGSQQGKPKCEDSVESKEPESFSSEMSSAEGRANKQERGKDGFEPQANGCRHDLSHGDKKNSHRVSRAQTNRPSGHVCDSEASKKASIQSTDAYGGPGGGPGLGAHRARESTSPGIPTLDPQSCRSGGKKAGAAILSLLGVLENNKPPAKPAASSSSSSSDSPHKYTANEEGPCCHRHPQCTHGPFCPHHSGEVSSLPPQPNSSQMSVSSAQAHSHFRGYAGLECTCNGAENWAGKEKHLGRSSKPEATKPRGVGCSSSHPLLPGDKLPPVNPGRDFHHSTLGHRSPSRSGHSPRHASSYVEDQSKMLGLLNVHDWQARSAASMSCHDFASSDARLKSGLAPQQATPPCHKVVDTHASTCDKCEHRRPVIDPHVIDILYDKFVESLRNPVVKGAIVTHIMSCWH